MKPVRNLFDAQGTTVVARKYCIENNLFILKLNS